MKKPHLAIWIYNHYWLRHKFGKMWPRWLWRWANRKRIQWHKANGRYDDNG